MGEWSGGGERGDDYNPEAFLTAETTLADHLEAQLSVAVSDPARRLIGINVTGLIDETGYFTGDPDLLAGQFGVPRDEVEAVLKLIQTFEPSGVGARNPPNASPSSCASATASTPPCRRWWPTSNSSPAMTATR